MLTLVFYTVAKFRYFSHIRVVTITCKNMSVSNLEVSLALPAGLLFFKLQEKIFCMPTGLLSLTWDIIKTNGPCIKPVIKSLYIVKIAIFSKLVKVHKHNSNIVTRNCMVCTLPKSAFRTENASLNTPVAKYANVPIYFSSIKRYD